MHIGQAEVSTRMFVGKFLVIQTQLVQDGGM
jgi:hypothetical protein